MYNPATLGSYFQKTKIAVGASPTTFPFKKKILYFKTEGVIIKLAWEIIVRCHVGYDYHAKN
jgi:hypothetical protein